MYRTFKIGNFRGIRELEIEGLKRVNLIAGMNNSGKTSLLEALFLHSCALNPVLSVGINSTRGMDLSYFGNSPLFQSAPWNSLFYGFDTSKTIQLTAELEPGITRQIDLSVKPLEEVVEQIRQVINIPERPQSDYALLIGTFGSALEIKDIENNASPRIHHTTLRKNSIGNLEFNTTPPLQRPPFISIILPARIRIRLDEDAARFSQLEVAGQEEELLNALRIVEGQLQRLTVIAENGVPIIYADFGIRPLIPLYLVGEGMSRLASIILAISDFKNGVVFIDEIENGLHYSVLENLWRVIYEAAVHYNVQVFATTHSLECIRAAHRTFENKPDYDFQLYRLDKLEDGSTRAVEYDRETLEAAIEVDIEVR